MKKGLIFILMVVFFIRFVYSEKDKKEEGIKDEMRYPGQYEIEGTPFYYNYSRIYIPEIGRYLTPDSELITDDNLYEYAGSNPVMNNDIYGNERHKYTAYNTAVLDTSFGILGLFKKVLFHLMGIGCGISPMIYAIFIDRVESDCNAKGKNKIKQIAGCSALLVGAGISILGRATLNLGTTEFKRIFDNKPYPDIAEMGGFASFAFIGVTFLLVSVQVGIMTLGNTVNHTTLKNIAKWEFGLSAGFGILVEKSWVYDVKEECCAK